MCEREVNTLRRGRGQFGRWGRGLVLAPLLAAACSVAANLSSSEILGEVDRIVRVEPGVESPQITYAPRAAVSQFYMRWPITYPFRWLLGAMFGRDHEVELSNAAEHVRELLRELPDETGDDLIAGAAGVSRCGWIAEFDDHEQSRIVAVDGLARLAQQLGLEVFTGPFEQFGLPADAARTTPARAVLQTGRPDGRDARTWHEAARQSYVEALATISERPLADRVERLQLVEDLTALAQAETDVLARAAIDAALRRSMRHQLEGTFRDVLRDRRSGGVDLRLTVMEQVRRLAGGKAASLLLALMVATPDQLARGEPRFESDALIQLRLIHYCGQLRGEPLHTGVKLPGQKDWDVTTPAEFLVTTILNEQAYYSKLRTPALAALSWSLGRARIDPDPTWVRQWNDERRP